MPACNAAEFGFLNHAIANNDHARGANDDIAAIYEIAHPQQSQQFAKLSRTICKGYRG